MSVVVHVVALSDGHAFNVAIESAGGTSHSEGRIGHSKGRGGTDRSYLSVIGIRQKELLWLRWRKRSCRGGVVWLNCDEGVKDRGAVSECRSWGGGSRRFTGSTTLTILVHHDCQDSTFWLTGLLVTAHSPEQPLPSVVKQVSIDDFLYRLREILRGIVSDQLYYYVLENSVYCRRLTRLHVLYTSSTRVVHATSQRLHATVCTS